MFDAARVPQNKRVDSKGTYHRALIDACTILGDETALAARLDQPVGRVVDWLMGTVPVPVKTFHLCVDILISSHRRGIDETEVFLAEVRRRNKLL